MGWSLHQVTLRWERKGCCLEKQWRREQSGCFHSNPTNKNRWAGLTSPVQGLCCCFHCYLYFSFPLSSSEGNDGLSQDRRVPCGINPTPLGARRPSRLLDACCTLTLLFFRASPCGGNHLKAVTPPDMPETRKWLKIKQLNFPAYRGVLESLPHIAVHTGVFHFVVPSMLTYLNVKLS